MMQCNSNKTSSFLLIKYMYRLFWVEMESGPKAKMAGWPNCNRKTVCHKSIWHQWLMSTTAFGASSLKVECGTVSAWQSRGAGGHWSRRLCVAPQVLCPLPFLDGHVVAHSHGHLQHDIWRNAPLHLEESVLYACNVARKQWCQPCWQWSWQLLWTKCWD